MNGVFRLDSKLMIFLTKVADLMILNILFIAFSLPVFTIGASITALNSVMIKIINDECTYPSTMFVAAFRSNFKQATLTFLIMLVPTALVGYELLLYFTGRVGDGLATTAIFMLPMVFLTMMLSYVYPLIAQFDNTLMGTIKNSAILSIANLPRSVVIGILNLLPFILLFFALKFFLRAVVIWFLIGFALTARANMGLLMPVFKKFYPPEMQEGDELLPESTETEEN